MVVVGLVVEGAFWVSVAVLVMRVHFGGGRVCRLGSIVACLGRVCRVGGGSGRLLLWELLRSLLTELIDSVRRDREARVLHVDHVCLSLYMHMN